MKLIVLFCLVAAAVAAPASPGDAEVVSYENDNIGTGQFKYAFVQSDGTKAEQTGDFRPGSGKDDEGFVAYKGSFEYIGADGVTYTATYTADENGYHVKYVQGPGGAIPEEVLKSLSSK